MDKEKTFDADVVIIGGGITGAAIARELAKYKVEVILIEKGGELCAGQSKVTLGNIYTGLNMVGSMVLKSVMLPPGTPLTDLYSPKKLLTKWSEQGFNEWGSVLKELDIKHRYEPLLILAKEKDQIEDLKKYIVLGKSIGGIYADFKEIDREEILALEPNVNKGVVTGLYAENHLIDIFPPEVVIAMVENASQNGVRVMLDAEVTSVRRKGDCQVVQTAKGTVLTRFIINAGGLWADKIADMAGGRDWDLQFNKTQLIILDKVSRKLLNSMIRWPNKPGLLQVVQARDENILIECGRYDPTDNRYDMGTNLEAVKSAMAMAKSLVPGLSEKDIISSFTGVRSFNTRNVEDHLVEFSSNNPRFLNVVIRLPGIIGALPMARYVVKMLADAGLELVTKAGFNPYREGVPRVRDLSNAGRNDLISKDRRFGHVICRCETVTEGEIVEAIKRGAVTLDGIKFRTRAGMGTCQSNFCSARVGAILARELHKPLESITKKGRGSDYVSFQ